MKARLEGVDVSKYEDFQYYMGTNLDFWAQNFCISSIFCIIAGVITFLKRELVLKSNKEDNKKDRESIKTLNSKFNTIIMNSLIVFIAIAIGTSLFILTYSIDPNLNFIDPEFTY